MRSYRSASRTLLSRHATGRRGNRAPLSTGAKNVRSTTVTPTCHRVRVNLRTMSRKSKVPRNAERLLAVRDAYLEAGTLARVARRLKISPGRVRALIERGVDAGLYADPRRRAPERVAGDLRLW